MDACRVSAFLEEVEVEKGLSRVWRSDAGDVGFFALDGCTGAEEVGVTVGYLIVSFMSFFPETGKEKAYHHLVLRPKARTSLP